MFKYYLINMKKLIVQFFLMLVPMMANADAIERNGFTYELNQTLNTASITKYNRFKYTGDKENVIIPNKILYNDVSYSVTSIGESAFYLENYMKTVTIPNSVTSIGEWAFYGCSGLTSVAIPNSMTTIGSRAFQECENLYSIEIPNSVQEIGENAFRYCTGLKIVIFGSGIKRINSWAFYMCDIDTIVIKDLYAWCQISFPIQQTQQTFDTYSWNNPLVTAKHLYINDEEVENLIIPDGIEKLLQCSFLGCRNIKTVSFPESLKSIGAYSFESCWNLKSIIIPNTVLSIGKRAFYACTNLESVVLGENISKIPKEAFRSCKNLKSFTSYSKKMLDADVWAFYECNLEDAILRVPEELVEEYKKNSLWNQFKEIVAISDIDYTLTYIVDGIIYKTYDIKEGMATTRATEPSKEGYTFSGWSEIPSTMPDHDVTVTGTFTINRYKLTYKVDGTNYKTYDVEYNSAITPEDAPTKEGCTFSGWSEIPETMPANDVTVTGTFAVNKYKLTYMVDDEEYKTSEVDYGTAITAEAVPTKEGYTFSGWSEIPSTMPAEDVTVTGTFTVNKYTITYMVDDAVLMTEEVAYGSTIAPPKSQKDGYDILWSFYPTTMPAYSITINGTYITGINALTNEEDERQVFTPDGKRVETPKKGLNIIRMNDGTVKKVVVK